MSLLDIFLKGIRASDDVIDACFIVSEMKDIPISEAERYERASLDALAGDTLTHQGDDTIPLGKLVL